MGIGLFVLTIKHVMDGIGFADVASCAALEAEEGFVFIQPGFGGASEDRPADCPWRTGIAVLDLDRRSMPLVQQEGQLIEGQMDVRHFNFCRKGQHYEFGIGVVDGISLNRNRLNRNSVQPVDGGY